MEQNVVLRVNTKSWVGFRFVNISRFVHVAFRLNPTICGLFLFLINVVNPFTARASRPVDVCQASLSVTNGKSTNHFPDTSQYKDTSSICYRFAGCLNYYGKPLPPNCAISVGGVWMDFGGREVEIIQIEIADYQNKVIITMVIRPLDGPE